MYTIAFDLDSLWCGGTKILAGTATYAEGLFDLGIHTPIYAALEFNSVGGTMLRAVAALHAIARHYALLTMKNCVAELRHTLFLKRQWQDSSRRADLTTKGTIVEAITLIVSHHGLHNALQTILHNGRLQDVRGTLTDAQVARRTLRLQVGYALRTRRRHGTRALFTLMSALRCLLGALLRIGYGDSGHSGYGSDKVSARGIGRFLGRGR